MLTQTLAILVWIIFCAVMLYDLWAIKKQNQKNQELFLKNLSDTYKIEFDQNQEVTKQIRALHS